MLRLQAVLKKYHILKTQLEVKRTQAYRIGPFVTLQGSILHVLFAG